MEEPYIKYQIYAIDHRKECIDPYQTNPVGTPFDDLGKAFLVAKTLDDDTKGNIVYYIEPIWIGASQENQQTFLKDILSKLLKLTT